jgi:small-conductance mechanosensitive channel
MAISPLGSANTLYSAFQLKQANVVAEQKAQQADNLRQSYEAAKQQADVAKQREKKLYEDTGQADQTASNAKNTAQDLQARTVTVASSAPENLFALHQSTKSNLTPYDITQQIVKGSLVNTTA